MAPSDGNQDTSLRGEALEKLAKAQDREANQLGQPTTLTTFHHYLHLPFELREQIRTAAIKAAYPNSNRSKWSQHEVPCSRLALISKEWRDSVERALFSEIRIDPSDYEDVAKFKKLFTDTRKRSLKRLDIAIDDDYITGPWFEEMGLLRISQVMEKVGQFFQYINDWEFCRDGEKQQSIEIIFTGGPFYPGWRSHKDKQPHAATSSLWDKRDLNIVTSRGLIPTKIPTNMALWAIKSEFPLSLNMVTHLTFPPDCVPLAAAQRIVQTMPNLETCVLEVGFRSDSQKGWKDFTGKVPPGVSVNNLVYETDPYSAPGFIKQLRISVPSLRNLTLHNRVCARWPFVPPSMVEFAAVLRDYSQSLECLRVTRFDLHHAFFLQFSEGLTSSSPGSKLKWPRLRNLELKSFRERSDGGPGQPTAKPADLLVAAGRAATAMPVLETAQIQLWSKHYLYIERESSEGFEGFRDAVAGLAGFDEGEEARILAAWAHFMGAEARLVKEESCGGDRSTIYESLGKPCLDT